MVTRMFSRTRLVTAFWILAAAPVAVQAFSGNVDSAENLEYGTVLFEYYQRDYFHALIEQRTAESQDNALAQSSHGQLVKGGMLLSYGVGDRAEPLFEQLLTDTLPPELANRAWYYLAKLHHSKGEAAGASEALSRVSGPVPNDVLMDYHYLASLVDGHSLSESLDAVESAARHSPSFPYFLFNLAVAQVQQGDAARAVRNLQRVTDLAVTDEASQALADRARHGLAELAMQAGQLEVAWSYLSDIRTTGLYSNRALISYAWAAINREQYGEAIPALELLVKRSIALPEVQEAKVLLAHLYEQTGYLKRALARNIRAEQEFREGVALIQAARNIIDGQDIPREFITNLQAIMDDNDWYAQRPSVDYQKLTPFLIDLMASNAFNETLKELADLYVIEDNLLHWSNQAEQHLAILEAADQKSFTEDMREALVRAERLNTELASQTEDLSLYTLVLDEREQARFDALIESSERELVAVNQRLDRLRDVDGAYRQPTHFRPMVAERHRDVLAMLERTRTHILTLEAVMRRLIQSELDEHEERMNYYAAQSRLAKARLYDMTLLSMEQGPSVLEGAVEPSSTQGVNP